MATTFFKTVDSLTNTNKKSIKVLLIQKNTKTMDKKERKKSLKILLSSAKSMKADGQNNNKPLNKLQ